MSAFFSHTYQIEQKFKRKIRAVAVFCAFGCICFLLAWSSLPSPFGEELGNDLAIALVGAFTSAAVVLGLDLFEMYEEVIDRAWRFAIKTHDYASDTGGVAFLPYYYSVEEAAELADEMFSKPLPGLMRRTECNEVYKAKRLSSDEWFSKISPEQQYNVVLAEVESWLEKAKPQIRHYYEMKCAARAMTELRPLLKMLPSLAVVRGFLGIADIADELISATNYSCGDREESLHEDGWGLFGINLLGLDACDKKMNHYVFADISEKQYIGQKYQVKLYQEFLRLERMPLSFAPKDREFFEPWGSTICPDLPPRF